MAGRFVNIETEMIGTGGASVTPSDAKAARTPDGGSRHLEDHGSGDRMDSSTRRACILEPSKNRLQHFSSNVVITAKYNALTFLPKNMFEQFRRAANIYFLIVSCLQMFTDLSPTGRYTTAGPLAGVLSFSMLRELFEDSKRHKADKEVNNRLVEALRMEEGAPAGSSSFQEVPWSDIEVGDVVRVKNRQEFPADLVLLSSSADMGMAYIETSNLDGETNLKLRQALKDFQSLKTAKDLDSLKGNCDYELPNNRLYNFSGKLEVEGKSHAIGNDNVALRGARLRNTEWVAGLVVYTGPESKIMMNMRAAPSKQSNLEKVVNKTLLLILAVELLLCMISTILNGEFAKTKSAEGAWYMPYVQNQSDGDTAKSFITYFILLNNFVPISLYVTVEVVKVFQAMFMNDDLEMYHEETDTPALCRTSNLNEELGQVEYIFSDKTGTLTRNEMEFRKCSIAGVVYGYGTTEIGLAAAKRRGEKVEMSTATKADCQKAQANYSPQFSFDDSRLLERMQNGQESASIIREFFVALATAHTVVPENDPDNPADVLYQAESPDEGALTFAARCLGFFFHKRNNTSVFVKEILPDGDMEYQVLNVNKFNSTRKRMSVVLRRPDGSLVLYVKGADNVMLKRLASKDDIEQLSNDLEVFANEGLRTLVIAKKELKEDYWKEWNSRHHEASVRVHNREQAMDEVAEEVETELELLGATAIEDKLQVGVPDAIATMAKANIKIWVLTGDKEETAVNIGFACQLLTNDIQREHIVGTDMDNIKSKLETALTKYPRKPAEEQPTKLALVVDGDALTLLEQDVLLSDKLLEFAKMCVAVIACRVSPKQKADIVKMVKTGVQPTPLTLAIGDGANDVSMIQEAHVGVGISGNEGLQAVRAADYAIAQFRFLANLLLVHGRLNYKRVAVVILYSFYKNSVLVMSLWFYSLYAGQSGTALLNSFMQASFNVVYSSIPIIIYGVFEADMPVQTCKQFPDLYMFGQRKQGFSYVIMARWLLNALLHSVTLVLFLVYVFLGSVVSEGGQPHTGHTVLGVVGGTLICAVINIKVALESMHFTVLSAGILLLSTFAFMIEALMYGSLPSFQFYQGPQQTYSLGVFWFICILTVPAAMLWDVIWLHIRRNFFPLPEHYVQYQVHKAKEIMQKPSLMVRFESCN